MFTFIKFLKLKSMFFYQLLNKFSKQVLASNTIIYKNKSPESLNFRIGFENQNNSKSSNCVSKSVLSSANERCFL